VCESERLHSHESTPRQAGDWSSKACQVVGVAGMGRGRAAGAPHLPRRDWSTGPSNNCWLMLAARWK
jgi:hypothetical protein